MKLSEYLESNSISVTALAELLGVRSRATIYRYIKGRHPDPEMMQKIILATSGQVTPNDFYKIPTSGQTRTKRNADPAQAKI